MNRKNAESNPAANSTVRQLSPVHDLEEDTVSIQDLVQQAREANESFIWLTAQIAQLSPSVSRGLGVSLNAQCGGTVSPVSQGTAEDVLLPSAVPVPRRLTQGTPGRGNTDREPASAPSRSSIAFPDFLRYNARASTSATRRRDADQNAGPSQPPATQPDRDRDLQRALEDLEIKQLRERNELMQSFQATGHQGTTHQQTSATGHQGTSSQQPRVSIVPERFQANVFSAFDPSQIRDDPV